MGENLVFVFQLFKIELGPENINLAFSFYPLHTVKHSCKRTFCNSKNKILCNFTHHALFLFFFCYFLNSCLLFFHAIIVIAISSIILCCFLSTASFYLTLSSVLFFTGYTFYFSFLLDF